jgi:hypothetical protein
MIKDTKRITRFWNQLKFSDQKSVCTSIKIAQMIIAISVSTVGRNAFVRYFNMLHHFTVLAIYLFRTRSKPSL